MPIEFKNRKNAAFMSAIEIDIDDIRRLINLVQDNQDFFNNPPAGQSCVKLATDKLENLIRLHKGSEPLVGTITLCKMCDKSIRYIGPYLEHLSQELQPRHPAVPK